MVEIPHQRWTGITFLKDYSGIYNEHFASIETSTVQVFKNNFVSIPFRPIRTNQKPSYLGKFTQYQYDLGNDIDPNNNLGIQRFSDLVIPVG